MPGPPRRTRWCGRHSAGPECAGSTVDDIARAAGVGVGTIYRRWPDKPSLANDVYALVLDVGGYHESKRRGGRTRKARFLNVWQGVCDFAKAEPEMFLFLEGQPHDAYIDARNLRRVQEKRAKDLALVGELGVTAPVEVASAMILGTVAQCSRSGADFDVDDLGDRLWLALST